MQLIQNTTGRSISMVVLLIFLIGIIGSNHDECYSQSKANRFWLSLNVDQLGQTSTQISVLKKTKTSIDFRIEIPKVCVAEFNDSDQKFHLLTIPEYGHIDEIGQPMLPIIIKSIAIPSSCNQNDIQIQISFSEFSVFRGYQLCPVPEIVEKRLSGGEVETIEEYKKNPTVYLANDFYPHELIKIDKIGFFRDQKLALLAICPFQYNPVTMELKIFHKMEISLTYNSDEIVGNKGWGMWNEFGEELFLNYDSSIKYSLSARQNSGKVTFPTNLMDPSNSADYLIITTDDLWSNPSLDSLAHLRAEVNGFDVAIVKIGDIYKQFPDSVNDRSISIKRFLTHVYNNWKALYFGDGHVGYILLVGEGEENSVNCLPTARHHDLPSDFRYTCINDDNNDGKNDDSDIIPDLMLGRFSVENHQELSTICRKTIHHEVSLHSDENWRKKISLFSGFVSEEHPNEINDLFEYLKKLLSDYDSYILAEELKRSEIAPDFVSNAFIQAINDGRAIINIQAHGGVDNWGDSNGWLLFHGSNISDLSNQNKLPIVFSFACLTGRFFEPDKDCLGEALLNVPDKGAVAFIGSTELTRYGENDRLNRTVFDYLLKLEVQSLGLPLCFANVYDWHFQTYTLLGDPALSLGRKIYNPLADLIVSKVDIKWSVTVDKPDTLIAKISNIGFKKATNVLVQIFDGDPQIDGQQIKDDQIISSIDGLGGYQIIKVLIDYVHNGELPVYVIVDPNNSIEEQDENNNTIFQNIVTPIFLDVTTASGLSHKPIGLVTAIGDYDNDSYLDLYSLNTGVNSLYKNDNHGTFSDVALQTGLTHQGGSAHASLFLDYDNDGDLDIFLTGLRTKPNDWYLIDNIFYKNDGSGKFGLAIPYIDNGLPLQKNVIACLDYDKDGLIDLYCIDKNTKTSFLYKNIGEGRFIDVTKRSGLDSTLEGKYVACGDYDNDGNIDIYVMRYKNYGNILYRNNGDGTLTDVTALTGVDGSGNDGWALFGDYDNDGDVDLFVYQGNSSSFLYQNDGKGNFINIISSAQIIFDKGNYKIGAFLDYDNDGYLDLLLMSNNITIYKNNRDCTFSKVDFITDKRNMVANIVLGDFENDGYIDLYGNGNLGDPNILYRNRGKNNNWLIVNLKGTISNSSGIGARVRIVAGDLIQIRDVTCDFGFGLQSSLPVEFGFGKRCQIDTVVIMWPSGIRDALTSVKINQVLTVKEGIGDITAPDLYQLSQNYPNPFNFNTTIQYTIKGNPHSPGKLIPVEISIYNLLSQKVRTIVDEFKIAGAYFAHWDGKDEKGNYVASGIYVYQIKAGEFIKSRKLAVVR